MKLIILLFGFAVIAHVKCQLHIEDILYGEDDEEDDQDQVTTSTTTRRPRRRTAPPAIIVFTPAPPSNPVNVRQRQDPLNATVATSSTSNITVVTGGVSNHTFVVKPANGTFFGSVVESTASQSNGTTERVHYVLGQVGNIWNNVGSLNITGIVDQALGIRNSQIARPLVTSILNVVFCNPLTFSNNNCRSG